MILMQCYCDNIMPPVPTIIGKPHTNRQYLDHACNDTDEHIEAHIHHDEEEHQSNESYFPLTNLFQGIKPKTALGTFGKQLLMMFSNLLPALSTSEVLDKGGEILDADLIFDFLKPIGAIVSRQGVVDGINKNNYHKAALASISAVSLLGANKFLNLPRFLMRPLLAVFLFGIEELGRVKELMGYKENGNGECKSQKCSHKHQHHKPSWGQLFTGLGILEVQLNTIAPIVSKLSNKIFESKNFITRATKVLFNTLFLSTGFVSLGEGLKYAAKHFSKSSNMDWLKDISKVIGNTMCGCCGAVGACATAAAEDISATAHL